MRVVTTGGMAGWQITLIAVGAAVLAGAVAIRLDRALTARPAGPVITAWRSRLARRQRRPGARQPVQRAGKDFAGRAASDQDQSIRPATSPPGTLDTIQFGRNPKP